MDDRTEHPGVRPDPPPPARKNAPALILTRTADGQTLELSGASTGRLCVALGFDEQTLSGRSLSSTFLPERRAEYTAEAAVLKALSAWVAGEGFAGDVMVAIVDADDAARDRRWRADAVLGDPGQVAA